MKRLRPAPALTVAGEKVASETEKPIHARWSFENGPVDSLRVLQGSWKWQRIAQRDAGFMAPLGGDVDTAVQLPINKIPAHPIRIRFKGFIGSIGYWALTVLTMSDSDKSAAHTRWTAEYKKTYELYATHEMNFYLFDNHNVAILNGVPISVREYDQKYPLDKVVFAVRLLKIESIEVSSIAPDELPQSLHDIPGLIKSLNMKAVRIDEMGKVTPWIEPSKQPH